MKDDQQRWDNYKSEIVFAKNGDIYKTVRSDGYNYNFAIKSKSHPGRMERWGYTFDDDPLMAPSPEILDIEVSTTCRRACSWCYKSNNNTGKVMSPNIFEQIITKVAENLTQVALGIGDIANVGYENLSRYFDICERSCVVPNITINGDPMEEQFYKLLANHCGTIDVSIYDESAYDVVKKLTQDYGAQCNLHCILADETTETNLRIISDTTTNKKLENIHAILFLMLKPKGHRNKLNQITYKDFCTIMDFALANRVTVGLDSCSAPSYTAYITERFNEKIVDKVLPYVEPCESGLFSLYINVDGEAFPCSFMEGESGWERGLSLVQPWEDFETDIWFHEKLIKWRRRLLSSTSKCNCSLQSTCRKCPEFELGLHHECKRT